MNWRVEFEEPSEERRNRKSGDGIPDKEHDDAVRSWLSLLPGNVGVQPSVVCQDPDREDCRQGGFLRE